jgi:hypothetical protein
MSTPRFVGAVLIVPEGNVDPAMKSDEAIEEIGMSVSMEYEKSNGRVPEDVSSENLGFDVRSTDEKGRRRYIEVKARAGAGAIALTQNEWFKAKRFGNDYYLYVVYNAATTPELYIVQDPGRTLRPKERFDVRYVVGLDDIRRKGVLIGR